jgi:hypothetical protein
MTPEEEALQRANAAGAGTALPGVGASGSTSTTDQTNLNVADAMSRADLGNRYGFGSQQYALGVDAPTEVLRARRDPSELIDNAITQRRQLLAQGVDPDRPAIYASPKRRQEMLHEELALSEIQHRDASTLAVGKAEAYRQQKDIETSNALHNFFTGMPAIDKLPEGSPERAQAFYNHVANNPLVATSPIGRDFIKTYAQTHDVASGLKQTATQDKEYLDLQHQAAEYGRSRGVGEQYDPQTGMPSVDLTRQYADSIGAPNPKAAGAAKATQGAADKALEHGLITKYGITPDQFINSASVKAGKIEGGKFTNQYPNAEKGDTIQIDTGQGMVNMPRADYNYFKRLHAATTPSEAPVATPDLKALAQKAIADPNASEAHKAAAKKVLGQ